VAATRLTIHVSDDELRDLQSRLRATRWPDEIPGAGWDYGTSLPYLQELCRYWSEEFDWRAAEDRLNGWDHFVTEIDGERMHYLHAVSPHSQAIPLVICHGWPGSIVEFGKVIGPLVDPPAYGGDAADAFHVVCPSMPGYAWSGPTRSRGWHIERVARAIATLMAQLGYDTYGAQGGDWGSLAVARLGLLDAAHLYGIHLNAVPLARTADPAEIAALSEDERAALAYAAWVDRHEMGYGAIQTTKPQSLAYGLSDSPAGLAGWIVEKFRTWSDCHGDIESVFTKDELLTNISAYWFTGTAGSAARLYYETRQAHMFGGLGARVETPTGIAIFPGELFRPPRVWAERAYNVARWTVLPRGGHFAAFEQPELFVADVRAFFRDLRPRRQSANQKR
jgi:pimeloyl-ACP methyl ester carboxylesterase